METADDNIPFQTSAKPWRKDNVPRRILAIRLQAMGDLVITLPYLQHLRNNLPPTTTLDLLTRKEVESIPKSLELFDQIYSIGGERNWKKQVAYTFLLLPRLLLRQYDVVIDLQNNDISKIVRKTIFPKAWSEFERFVPVPAGECTRLAIEAIGLGPCHIDSAFKIKGDQKASDLLKENGWDGKSELVLLNPAGAFETRNWPLAYYIDFARLWLQRYPDTQFLVLGVNFISSKATSLKQSLGKRLINLVNLTSPVQAFAILQKVRLVLSEDSGLMHMSWVSGIPTVALFGSTRSDRATPLGKHSLLLHSGDLPCGNCMREKCLFADNRCLTRYAPALVFEKAVELIRRNGL